MKMRRAFLFVALTVGVIVGSAGRAEAQFTMGSIGQTTDDPTVEMSLDPAVIDAHVLNRYEDLVLRKAAWRSRNDVDFRVSMTGMVTQFNKSWTTNNQNSVSSELAAYYYHTFTRDRYTSIFKFDGIYGMNYIEDAWFKNQDMFKFYYLSSWKMRGRGGVFRNWAYSFSSQFTSQFAKGFESRTNPEPWSSFMAPGTLNVGAGLTFTSPNTRLPFIVTLNPASGDALFVLDDRLSDERRQKLGITQARGADGRPIRYKIEGGSSINVAFNRTFTFGGGDGNGVSLQYITTLNSFYGWMTQLARHENWGPTAADGTAPLAIMPTVGWNNSLIFNPLKFLSMEFSTKTLYDRSQVDRVQMQYYLRVGLTYRYRNR
jgi:hypothetical protein